MLIANTIIITCIIIMDLLHLYRLHRLIRILPPPSYRRPHNRGVAEATHAPHYEVPPKKQPPILPPPPPRYDEHHR
eukprot:CAMPEP_0116044564 /NCGR_PEP_ID=MMETSP0321-20121206/27078_1 /TAXON_ID=163516 /ORGANISM="Leptocylindrus danicus var. danicus, Strain B650" /LENGTH=75 /DNA_ID=CAMNT_0003525691 /DNA_START=381 /DNA_END=604 /DNA_ORIENTATION=-